MRDYSFVPGVATLINKCVVPVSILIDPTSTQSFVLRRGESIKVLVHNSKELLNFQHQCDKIDLIAPVSFTHAGAGGSIEEDEILALIQENNTQILYPSLARKLNIPESLPNEIKMIVYTPEGDVALKDLPADLTEQLNKKLEMVTEKSANPRIYGISEDGEQTLYFATQTHNAYSIAQRDASGRFQINDGIAPKQAINKSQLDSAILNLANTKEQNVFEDLNTFKESVQFNKGLESDGNISVTNSVIKILNNSNNAEGLQKDYVTQYDTDKIIFEENISSYTLGFPRDSGTFLLNKFKYSEFSSSEDSDSWKLTDGTKGLELRYQDDNSLANIYIEKDYLEISDINGTGTAKISLASNIITLDSENREGGHKIIRITPDNLIIGNSTDSSLVEIDSNSAKFNNRPKVRDNGNYIDVAISSDLGNYATIQSESTDHYYSQLANENGIISARIFKNGEEDTQNLIIDKDGIKILGKKVVTEDKLTEQPSLYKHTLVSLIRIDGANFSLITNLLSYRKEAYTSLESLPVTNMENIESSIIATDSDGNSYKSQISASYYSDRVYVSGVYIKSDSTISTLQNTLVTMVTAIESYSPIKIA